MMAVLMVALLFGQSPLLEAARGGRATQPMPDELTRSRELFRRTLGTGEPASLTDAWRQLGFDLDPVDRSRGIWALRELPERREGRGFYLFRIGPAAPLAIQAPHGVESDDMLTGDIALALFERHDARVGAWSTVPREEIDLAHTAESAFHELTRAFADTFGPRALVVQIHGYRRDRRSSPEGRESAAILSEGTREPGPALARAARCLGGALNEPVGTYPRVPELGAVTNAQGRELRARGGPRFLHVELSYPLRRRLVEEVDSLDVLGRCLLEVES